MVFPKAILVPLNFLPERFQVLEATPEPAYLIWTLPLVILMLVLSALSFLSSSSPQVLGFHLVHILAKVASAAGMFWIYKFEKPYFACVVGMGVEISLALLLIIFGIGSSWDRRKERRALSQPLVSSELKNLKEADTLSIEMEGSQRSHEDPSGKLH